ncbi:hypothetical protein CMU25_09380 [Elizabethkingia anophelis]|nr:hypothetical protein [Elizabethkingia anophelis]MDV3840551.1 hypothetical protein [Elizabethkingia anophelis]
MIKNNITYRTIGLSIISSSVLLLSSCRNTSEVVESDKGMATVAIRLQGSYFSDEGSIGNQASISNKPIVPITEQKQEIPLKGNDDYKLVATLSPVDNIEALSPQASTKIDPQAATTTKPLTNGIIYKVVVYDNSGNYVTQKDYSSGQENTTGAITGLNGGSTYTFVAYSIGSKTSVPSLNNSINVNSTSNPIVTLSNMSAPVSEDLMYYTTTMQVSGNSMNYLNINLLHKFSQIVTTLDSSLTGTSYGNSPYSINAVTATIDSNFNNASLFGNGTYSSTGSGSGYQTQTLTFSNLNSSTVTANPIYVNNATGTTTGNFTISSVTLMASGTSITHQNVVFSGLKITPGVKYNLKLSFTPNDKYLTYRGYPAVRINGFVWMQQNLGATGSPGAVNSANIGNYYQWGRKTPVANGSTGSGAISGWDNTTIPANNSWNTGTAVYPVKNTTNDPCPNGWRVATDREYDRLRGNTTYSVVGNTSGTTTDPGLVAGKYASKTTPSVTITFPLAGFRDANDGHFVNGTSDIEGQYWLGANAIMLNVQTKTSPFSTGITAGANVNTRGLPVRCIAESPLSGL